MEGLPEWVRETKCRACLTAKVRAVRYVPCHGPNCGYFKLGLFKR